MNAIVLYGRSNLGKTTTLKKTIRVLLEKGYKAEKSTENLEQIIADSKNKDDVYALFVIDGKKVGISTHGDNEDCYNNDFRSLGECDFNVCACHTRGQTIDYIKSKFNKNIIWINKFSYEQKNNYFNGSEMQNQVNELQANYLAELIVKITK